MLIESGIRYHRPSSTENCRTSGAINERVGRSLTSPNGVNEVTAQTDQYMAKITRTIDQTDHCTTKTVNACAEISNALGKKAEDLTARKNSTLLHKNEALIILYL